MNYNIFLKIFSITALCLAAVVYESDSYCSSYNDFHEPQFLKTELSVFAVNYDVIRPVIKPISFRHDFVTKICPPDGFTRSVSLFINPRLEKHCFIQPQVLSPASRVLTFLQKKNSWHLSSEDEPPFIIL